MTVGCACLRACCVCFGRVCCVSCCTCIIIAPIRIRIVFEAFLWSRVLASRCAARGVRQLEQSRASGLEKGGDLASAFLSLILAVLAPLRCWLWWWPWSYLMRCRQKLE